MKSYLPIFCFALSGCVGTVHPHSVSASLPAFTGNATSGIIVSGIKTGGSYVEQEWLLDYNKFISYYGTDSYFKHPLAINEGIKIEKGGAIWATDEAHHNYGMMAGWRRSGTHKPKNWLEKATGL